MQLGKTSAVVAAAARAACGDVRDTLIAEYTNDQAVYRPTCSDFSAAATWPNTGGFTFAALTPGQTTGAGQFAVLQSYMCTNLQAVFDAIDFSTQINQAGGYRNPDVEKMQKVYYNNSRHMAGDAADISTSGNGDDGYAMEVMAGHNNGACAEPLKNSRHQHLYSPRLAHSGNRHIRGTKQVSARMVR